MTEARDYRDTVFLPKTDFPMKAGLPQKEPGILARWKTEGLYQQLRAARQGREKFILHDGPPYANGDMHIGHALNHILKDMVVRTQSLLGKDAPYVPGWDCHGLPIEWKVEEQYRKKKLDKDQVDPVEFRAECRAYAQHWVDTQREQLKRLGINADWDNPYLTMDFAAEATIVAELMKFAESGQLYRGAKPVMWSPVEKTALAEAEVEYEDIVSTQVDVAFEITECPNVPELVGAHAVIWTTTPWTIPVNQALAYGAEVDYACVWVDGRKCLVAYHLIDEFLRRVGDWPSREEEEAMENVTFLRPSESLKAIANLDSRFVHETKRYKGSDLAGTIARHPMAKLFEKPLPFRGGVGGGGCPDGAASGDRPHPNPSPEGEGLKFDPSSPMAEFFLRPRPFLDGSDFVTTETGTGLVHMAPDHGEDDFALCKSVGIEPVFAVEADGKYRADWAWLGGQGSVINAKFNAPDGPICEALREAGGLLAASADYKHSYPHSWRSKAKVIYRCTPQWFVPMDRPLTHLPAKTPAEKRWESEGGAIDPQDEAKSASPTLREAALGAITETRWVPEKGENRIRSMVEGRPDWVLSRQRAWGVPITLFVKKGTNQYLADPAVNARIVAGIKEAGVDAWSEARAQAYLGADYKSEDFERVTDILDVWFDSGCTHVFTLESGRWPELSWPADLYLEGSDQHRGWFQSSLLESCATRGRAPYKAVLTHGFTMDQKGMKMSKSLGNTIDPLKVMETNGADIIRLWALSVDYTEDHRIGDEILKGVADQYRKLRNTFRYLLGALEGYEDSTKAHKGTETGLNATEMPELERYMLATLAQLDATLRQAVADYDFNSYVRALTDFCNEDLSAFFFDIRKDCLYCDAADNPKRMAYRTVLDVMFHALVRYAAPVLVFTAEEVWGTRFPDAGSVHLLEWPEVDAGWFDEDLVGEWALLREFRAVAFNAAEIARREKFIGSSMEAAITLVPSDNFDQRKILEKIDQNRALISEVFITSSVNVTQGNPFEIREIAWNSARTFGAVAHRSEDHKCGRCWRHLPDVAADGALCSRCDHVVAAMDAAV